jgi:hypothetical protein
MPCAAALMPRATARPHMRIIENPRGRPDLKSSLKYSTLHIASTQLSHVVMTAPLPLHHNYFTLNDFCSQATCFLPAGHCRGCKNRTKTAAEICNLNHKYRICHSPKRVFQSHRVRVRADCPPVSPSDIEKSVGARASPTSLSCHSLPCQPAYPRYRITHWPLRAARTPVRRAASLHSYQERFIARLR